MPEPWTTADIRIMCQAGSSSVEMEEARGAAFDRWLSAYTTRIREEAVALIRSRIDEDVEPGSAEHYINAGLRNAANAVEEAWSEIPEGQN